MLRRTAALTWLNPHVYLDTMVLLGSVAAAQGPSGRWWFTAGACAASLLWFAALGWCTRFAARLLATARAWQALDLLIAATMLAIAVKLAVSPLPRQAATSGRHPARVRRRGPQS